MQSVIFIKYYTYLHFCISDVPIKRQFSPAVFLCILWLDSYFFNE